MELLLKTTHVFNKNIVSMLILLLVRKRFAQKPLEQEYWYYRMKDNRRHNDILDLYGLTDSIMTSEQQLSYIDFLFIENDPYP